MGIENPNYQTGLPILLAKAEPSVNFTFVDIGARGGVRSEWLPFQSFSKFVAFEPDAAEAEKIKAKYSSLDVYSVALGEKISRRKIYLTRSPDCCGLTQIDKVFWKRFPNWINAEVVGTAEIEVKSLDEWVAGTEYKTLDFLKIDTEGSEIEILRGAKNSFETKKILGVLAEWWADGITRDSPGGYGLESISTEMSKHHLYTYDITCLRYPRTSLPVGKLKFVKREDGGIIPIPDKMRQNMGQALTGEVLFFRDPIQDFRKLGVSYASEFWTQDTLIKLMSLLDLYNYTDVALDILSFFAVQFTKQQTADLLAALLQSIVYDEQTQKPLGYINLPYNQYFEISKKLFLDGGGLNSQDLLKFAEITPPVFNI